MAKKKQGKLYELPDGRLAIVYNEQPLLSLRKVVITLIGYGFEPLKTEAGSPRVILKHEREFHDFIKTCKLRGFID